MKKRPRAFRTEAERDLARTLEAAENSPHTLLKWAERLHAETLEQLAPLEGGEPGRAFLHDRLGRTLDGKPIAYCKAETELDLDRIRLLNATAALVALLRPSKKPAEVIALLLPAKTPAEAIALLRSGKKLAEAIAYVAMDVGACLAVVQGREAVEEAIGQSEARARGGKSRKLPDSEKLKRKKRLREIFDSTKGKSTSARLRQTAAQYYAKHREQFSETQIARDLGLRD